MWSLWTREGGSLSLTSLPLFQELSEALLEEEDCNVIAVDWGGGSLPLYSQAAANTRLVGLEVAHLVSTLKVQMKKKFI